MADLAEIYCDACEETHWRCMKCEEWYWLADEGTGPEAPVNLEGKPICPCDY